MKRFGQKGQSAIEYLLIVAVLVGVIMVFGKTLKDQLASVTSALFGQISTKLQRTVQDAPTN
jgi:Flp pilus assembly pilin Flp